MGFSYAKTREHFDAFACPSCHSYKLHLTKEKIIICQGCFTGYRVRDGVPDFRLQEAISFKKKISSYQKAVEAELTVLNGEHKGHVFILKNGSCVVMGRAPNGLEEDVTIVGKARSAQFVPLNSENQLLIERYLTRHSSSTGLPRHPVGIQQNRHLGTFLREPDFLLADPSVSRAHAVIYQDDDGVHILDLVSKNGTFVNGHEVEAFKLKNNDVLSIGTTSLRLAIR